MREMFPDISSPDVCTDPACYRSKEDAWWLRKKEEVEAGGQHQSIIDRKEWESLGYHARDGYVTGSDKCWRDDKNRTWAQLAKLGGVPPILAYTDAGVKEVYPRAEVGRAAVKAGVKGLGSVNGAQSAADKAAAAKARIEAQVEDAVIGDAIARVEKVQPDLEFWRLMTQAAAVSCWHDSRYDVLKRRGLIERGVHDVEVVRKLMPTLTEAQCRGLLWEVLVCRGLRGSWGIDKEAKLGLKLLRVPADKIRARVVAEIKAKAKNGRNGKHGKDGKTKAATPKML